MSEVKKDAPNKGVSKDVKSGQTKSDVQKDPEVIEAVVEEALPVEGEAAKEETNEVVDDLAGSDLETTPALDEGKWDEGKIPPVGVIIEDAISEAESDADEDVSTETSKETNAMTPEEKLSERKESARTLSIQDQIAMRRMSSYSSKIPTALAIRRRKAGMR